MALDPLTIATQGIQATSTVTISVQGFVADEDTTPPETIPYQSTTLDVSMMKIGI